MGTDKHTGEMSSTLSIPDADPKPAGWNIISRMDEEVVLSRAEYKSSFPREDSDCLGIPALI
jgi:hypothetical protein